MTSGVLKISIKHTHIHIASCFTKFDRIKIFRHSQSSRLYNFLFEKIFLFVVGKMNNSIDCFRVIFIGLFVLDEEYSIISMYIYIKLSDYISHSMKLNVCFVYLKVKLKTTRWHPLLASWRTYDLQRTIDPLFTITTCLKQTLLSSRQLSISFRTVCRCDRLLSRRTLHNHRHSSRWRINDD